MAEVIVKLEKVSLAFQSEGKRLSVLKEIDLEIENGEKVAIIGPSGCGKSTLLRLMCGFLVPHSGRVLYRGRSLRGVLNEAGYLFQNYALFPWMTVAQNIAFPLKRKGVREKEALRKVQELVQWVHLEGFAQAYPNQLSGGMRQRVALARLLAHDPEVFLMDEPFSALDAMTRRYLRDEVIELLGKSGKTLVLVTHDIEEAASFADKVFVLTSRPARIKEEIRCPYPVPRKEDEILKLKQLLWELVRDEVEQSLKQKE